ncbi:anti-sigma factor domain-containing protein [Bacillus tianshenii]|nr:anti-sigma factor domain-containing protein [Bacillus tianshenii]
MKRGIVMDVRKRRAVVLTKDGEFKKVPLKKYPYVAIGEEVVVPASSAIPLYSKSIPLFSAAAAAAIFLVILLSSFPLSTNDRAVAAFIGLDINPSVEAGINHQLEVIELKALNEDGKKIISQIGSVDEMPLQQLLTAFLAASKSSGYLKKSKDMLVTTTLLDSGASMQQPIASAVDKWKQQNVEGTDLALTTMQGNNEQRQLAHDNGVSTGKYLMYLQAKEGQENMTIDEVKTLSVEQLNNRLNPSEEQMPEMEEPVEVPAAVESVGQADTSGQAQPASTNSVEEQEEVEREVVEMEEGLKSAQFVAPVPNKAVVNEKASQPRKPQLKKEKKKKDKKKQENKMNKEKGPNKVKHIKDYKPGKSHSNVKAKGPQNAPGKNKGNHGNKNEKPGNPHAKKAS